MNTDTHTSGSTVKNHISLKTVFVTNNDIFNCVKRKWLRQERGDLCGIDSYPAAVSSKQPKKPKTKYKWGPTSKNGETHAIPKYRNGISQTRRIYFSSRRWTYQSFWRRSGTENTTLIRENPVRGEGHVHSSWRIRRVSSTTSRLTSRCRWSNKRLLVHVRKLHFPPSRWTQSQTLLAERRIIPYSIEIQWRLQNYTYKLGCYVRMPHRWLLEYRWIKRFVCFLDRFHPVYSIEWETSRRIYMVGWETDKTAKWHPGKIIYGQSSG